MMSMIENLETRRLLAVITNGLAPGDANFIEATVNGGGALSSLAFDAHPNVMFAYQGYLDLGANNAFNTARVINLAGLQFLPPININNQTAQSQVIITLDSTTLPAPQITITATSHIPTGSMILQTDYTFNSTGYNMANAAFYQYMDADIRNITDDVFKSKGSIANNNLQVSTVNPTELVWVSQANGTDNQAALLGGFAADTNPNLIAAIMAGGFVPAATGTISPALPPGTFPGIGAAFGPGDVTSCTYYTFNGVTGNTVSTQVNIFVQPAQPLMQVTFNANLVPNGSTLRSAQIGTDFGTLLGVPVTHYFQIENIGTGQLQLSSIPAVQVTGADPSDFIVTRQPAPGTSGGGFTIFAIQYLPMSSGVRSATITIGSNDLNSTPYTFVVFGGIGNAVQPDVFEPDNTFAQAKIISTDGVWQYHSIHVTNDVDYMTFTLSRDSTVTIQTTDPIGDTMLRLFDANGQQIAKNNDFNPGLLASNVTSRIVKNLTAGTYFISVMEFGQNATIPLYGVSVTAGFPAYVPVTYDPFTGALVLNGTAKADTMSVDVFQTALRAAVNGQMSFYPLAAVKSVFIFGRAAADTIFVGRGVTNVVVQGNAGNDSITLDTNTPTTVYSGNGDDSIVGGNGGDFIFLGVGNDTVLGGNGNNFIQAGVGNSIIISGNGNDTILGGVGNDEINSGNGDDFIQGGQGNDTIRVGSGNDTIIAGQGDNLIFAGSGSDFINAQNGLPDTIHANQARDTVLADAVDTVIYDVV